MKKLLLAACLAASTLAHATTPPTYINVVTATSGCLTDATGAAMAKGTVTFTPVNAGSPTPLGVAGTLASSATVTRGVATGSLVGTVHLANPAVTQPPLIGYDVTISNANYPYTSNTYSAVPITADNSGNWNLCGLLTTAYTPAPPSIPLSVGAVVTDSTSGLQYSVSTCSAGLLLTPLGATAGTCYNPASVSAPGPTKFVITDTDAAVNYELVLELGSLTSAMLGSSGTPATVSTLIDTDPGQQHYTLSFTDGALTTTAVASSVPGVPSIPLTDPASGKSYILVITDGALTLVKN